ncbi:MAG: Beta-barrel assembly-enhancing protease [Gammaproteobacteria bacterium]|nr:Beta-barrel assembly-enhancing protease [Gammaproteobacteria bacterium]
MAAAGASALGRALRAHQQGALQPALKAYLEHLKAHPADAQTSHTVAGVHLQLDDLVSAQRYFAMAADLAPANADYQNDLGSIHLATGNLAAAEHCFRKALALAPAYAQAWANLGQTLFRMGKSEEALNALREAVRLEPDFADAHYNLGIVLRAVGVQEQASIAFENALRIRPDLAIGHVMLGQVQMALERNEAAVASFRRALELAPEYPDAKLGLATALVDTWQIEKAIPLLRQLTTNPAHRRTAHLVLGRALEVAGRLQDAEAAYRTVLKCDPDSAGAWYGLSSAKKFREDDTGDIAAMERLVASEGLDDAARSALHFALGKAHDDCRRYDEAFRHYHLGNTIRRRALTGSVPDLAALTEEIIGFFDERYFAGHRGIGSDSDVPIFIVGMPRSGTTLTEQIISSHPSVHGAGELAYFARLAHGLHALLRTPERFPFCCAAIDNANAATLVDPYLKLLRWHSATAPRITDKMPTNYRYLGLIATLFPKAAIIHCTRDAMDTCLSIYFQSFQKGHEYSYELREIGETYNRYARMMRHWELVLPGRIHTSSYEELVANPEARARALVAACGLPWEERCLAFHEQKRDVRTASIAQVRQPIYTRSAQRWRNYEQHLGPLKEALGLE